ncbi:MAG: outer membrane lipoprotein carrier protein LolA [Myxococcales bacterium]|nr:outer membrane lipoprotein carrier protein LolA [Myxococcales bacterium]
MVTAFGADDPLRSLANVVERAEVVRAQFAQEKRIPGFDVPFRSSGRVVIVRHHGVVWFAMQPVESRTVMRTGPTGSGAVVATLLSVMGGDVVGLGASFQLTLNAAPTPDVPAWALELTPKDDGIATVVKRIEVRGRRFVELVTLTETSGDVTQLRLTGHTTATNPTPEELREFTGQRD